jgi:hypothetical protein
MMGLAHPPGASWLCASESRSTRAVAGVPHVNQTGAAIVSTSKEVDTVPMPTNSAGVETELMETRHDARVFTFAAT